MHRDPRVAQHHRQVALVTHQAVLHSLEKEALIGRSPVWGRKAARQRMEAEWAAAEAQVASEIDLLLTRYDDAVTHLERALDRLRAVTHVRLSGKIADERTRLTRVRSNIAETRAALAERDFGAAGRALHTGDHELWTFGGQLIVALNEELRAAVYSRELQQELARNQQQRRAARLRIEEVRRGQGQPEALSASVDDYLLMAQGLELVAEALQQHDADLTAPARPSRTGVDEEIALTPPQELERLADVGGLTQAKEEILRILGGQLTSRDNASRYGVQQTSILLYGPPGTGKTLLARATAGELGLRFLRTTPASIASPYQHGAVKNLKRVFEVATQSLPCLLFIDEIDALGSSRGAMPVSEQRELVSQLSSLMEDHRKVSRLVIVGATNAPELLDAALREGRFDVRIPVPMPDTAARLAILEVHLRSRASAVAWQDIDLDEIAQRLAGRSAAAVAAVVTAAAHHALRTQGLIGQSELLAAIGDREARDRRQLEQPVRWDDVVLPEALDRRLKQLFSVVQHPELAEAAGISAPAGIILHGPPGTGKTTIAKALATEVKASFYEMSAAELLSKWVGESEERVRDLFDTARDNRPSIIFIDEIDALLRRRNVTSVAPWEERLVSQFLRELDGLSTLPGVFLVGATNRLDIIDEAIKNRRLMPVEVPLPDLGGRRLLLDKLFARVHRSDDVDLEELARATDGMTGADLKRMRDEVGIKALSRGLQGGDRAPSHIEVNAQDFYETLHERRAALIPD